MGLVYSDFSKNVYWIDFKLDGYIHPLSGYCFLTSFFLKWNLRAFTRYISQTVIFFTRFIANQILTFKYMSSEDNDRVSRNFDLSIPLRIFYVYFVFVFRGPELWCDTICYVQNSMQAEVYTKEVQPWVIPRNLYEKTTCRNSLESMMTSSNRNIFHITGPLCGEFTSHWWIPHTKASDAQLWGFLWSVPE